MWPTPDQLMRIAMWLAALNLAGMVAVMLMVWLS